MKKKLAWIWAWIWQFPQMLLGYIMSRLWKKRLILLPKKELEYLYGLEELTGCKIYVADYYSHKNDKVLGEISGFGMGRRVCLNSLHKLKTIKHEKGHCRIGDILGWLFLLLNGAPSAIGNLLARKFEWVKKNYYKLPWEWLADYFGGVKRG